MTSSNLSIVIPAYKRGRAPAALHCGFKLFAGGVVAPIFSRTRIDRFGFDVEVLALAQRLGVAVAEVPVRWRNSPGSRVTLGQGARAFLDPIRVCLGVVFGRCHPRRAPGWAADRRPAPAGWR
jgi:hypothetical protein